MKQTLLLLFMTFSVWALQAQENCPVVEDTQQEFCESEGTGNDFHRPMVSDLVATANGGGVAWYASADAQAPLAPETLLENGASYFAGSEDGSCGSRVEVGVIIRDAPNAGSTSFLSFCASDDPVDLLTLMNPSLLGPPEAGGTFTPALASGTTVFDPAVDTEGEYEYRVESSNDFCPDDIAVVYIEISPNGSAGVDASTSVARDAAPIDLFTLLGDTAVPGGTWSPELNSGTGIFDPSVDAQGAYTYSISDACGEDSATVTVQVGGGDDPTGSCPVVENPIQEFCESEGTGNDYYRPAVAHLQAVSTGDEIVWYDTATSTEPLSQDMILLDGEDYYAGNSSGTCTSRQMVTVVVNDAPNAGGTTQLTLCSDSEPVDLLDYYEPSILGAPDAGGTFSPALASGTTVFDPSVDAQGDYTYTVSSSTADCPDDWSVINITVIPAPNAGTDGVANFSADNSPQDLFNFLGGEPDTGGTWSPALASGTGVFDPAVDSPGEYTYTVQGGEGCGAASATVTVVTSSDPVAQNCPTVEFTSQRFCESEGTGNNYYRPAVKHLAATANGDAVAWYDTPTSVEALSPEEILLDGEDYYAGNVSGTCSSRTQVIVTLDDSPNAGGTTFITVNVNDEPFDLLDVYEPSILGAPDAGGTITPPLASGTTIFDPSLDQSGEYQYTVESTNAQCPDDFSYITITVEGEPVAADSQAKVNVTLYPNPSHDQINFSTSAQKIAVVRIFDMNGNLIMSQKNRSGKLENLNISNLRPAIYFAEISTDKGKVVKRFVKN